MSFAGNMFKVGVVGYLATSALKGLHNGNTISQLRNAGYGNDQINFIVRHADRYHDGFVLAAYNDLCAQGRL